MMKKVTVHTRCLKPSSKVFEGKTRIGTIKPENNREAARKELSFKFDWNGTVYKVEETRNNLDKRNWTLHKQEEQAGSLAVPSRPSALGNPDYEPSQLFLNSHTFTVNEGENGRLLTLMNEQSETSAELRKKGIGKVEISLHSEEDAPLFLLVLYLMYRL